MKSFILRYHFWGLWVLLVITSLICPITICTAQKNPSDRIKKTSLGISVGHYDMDLGVSFNITTPLFLQNRFSLRFAGSLQWLEYNNKANNFMWIPYHSTRSGIVYNFEMIDRSRVYFEAGYCLIMPNTKFSEKKLINGGYGAVGVELFFYQHPKLIALYYFEVGLTQVNAEAEKRREKIRYSSGLTFTTGFRFHPF
jgi:hypothetical protein